MEEITELEKKYYKLLIGETFHCYDITLNELLIIMNAELNINTLSLQKSGRHNFYCRVDDKTKQYYLRKFDLLNNGNKHILKDSIKDKNGKYHDDIIYEIVSEE